jgi:uncharacterized SAM-binding protein YcdF (DUF218 family)
MTCRFPAGSFISQHGGIISSLVSLLFLFVLLIALYVARRPLLRLAGESWVVEDPLQQSDAIIILSDDNFFADRATRASELFRQKLAPVVVASGRRLRPSAGIAELMEHDLIERGVPKDRIIRFPHDADSTREEAGALAPLIAEHNWHSIIVVTSNYHTRRARYIFNRVIPSTVTVRVASARDGSFDVDNWWQYRKSLKEFTRELAGMVVAMWELRGGPAHTTTASENGADHLEYNGVSLAWLKVPLQTPGTRLDLPRGTRSSRIPCQINLEFCIGF